MSWAFITGASSGIGAATANQLAAAGYDLLLAARREDRLQSVAEAVRAKGRQARTVVMDVTDEASIARALEKIPSELADLEILLNNAGLAKGTEKFQNGKTADWDVMFDTNVKGLMHLTRAVLPGMIARKKGHIVNLGSVAGRWVYPGGAVYAATKFAVRALSEGLRMDLAGTGVRVTNIEPGMVNTEFSAVRLGSKEASDRVYERMTPLVAEDIAESIVWCVRRPAHVNIQELVIFPTDQAAVGQVHRS